MPRPRPISNRGQLPKPSGYFVYCYLRTDSNRPYYIGQGSRPDRMTARHKCKIPTDRSRIRVMREGLTKEEADRWEIFYIERYGRKADGGCLVNRREGGHRGGNDDETKRQISKKVAELHTQGVFDKLNTPETAKRRAYSRAANKAAELGIPEADYIAMPRWQRGNAQRWLRSNPEKTYADWVASRKTAAAATKYGLTVDEWNVLDKKQKNCLKEWMLRWPGRNPHDWLAGVRAKGGSKPVIDRAEVAALRAQGMTTTAIARQLGCDQSSISRILSGRRRARSAS